MVSCALKKLQTVPVVFFFSNKFECIVVIAVYMITWKVALAKQFLIVVGVINLNMKQWVEVSVCVNVVVFVLLSHVIVVNDSVFIANAI